MQAGDDVVRIASGPGSDDGRRRQRAALPRRPSRRRAAPARAADPGAQSGVADVVAGAPRRGARGFPRGRERRADACTVHRRRGAAFVPCGSRRSDGRAATSCPWSWSPATVNPSPDRDPANSSRSSSSPAVAPRHSSAATRSRDRPVMPATGSASRSNSTARPARTSAPGSESATALDVGAPRGVFTLDDGERPIVLVERRSRGDADDRHVARAPRRSIDPRHLVAARRTEPGGTRLRRRGAGALGTISPTCTVTSSTADRPRRTAPAPTTTRSGTSPRRRSKPWASRPTRSSTCAARPCSWTRLRQRLSELGVPDDVCTRRSSVRRGRSRPASSHRRRGRRTNRKARRDRDRSSRSCGPASTCVGATGSGASSSSPRRATCRCDGPVARASATPARPVSSTGRSSTPPNHSRRPPTATCSSAARARTPTSSIDL